MKDAIVARAGHMSRGLQDGQRAPGPHEGDEGDPGQDHGPGGQGEDPCVSHGAPGRVGQGETSPGLSSVQARYDIFYSY